MVDYFEHDDTHLINRMSIIGFLEEMIGGGQMTRFPGLWLAPAEMFSVIELAKEYGLMVQDDRPHKDDT